MNYESEFLKLCRSCERFSKNERIVFSEDQQLKLQEKIQKTLKKSVGISRGPSFFSQTLELVDDLFVATDYAYQQCEKSKNASVSKSSDLTQHNLKSHSSNKPQQNHDKVSTKRDNSEFITEDDNSEAIPSLQQSKKAKRLPFQSAKDKFKSEVKANSTVSYLSSFFIKPVPCAIREENWIV